MAGLKQLASVPSAFAMQFMDESDDDEENELLAGLRVSLPPLGVAESATAPAAQKKTQARESPQPQPRDEHDEEAEAEARWMRNEFARLKQPRAIPATPLEPAAEPQAEQTLHEKLRAQCFEKDRQIRQLQAQLRETTDALQTIRVDPAGGDSAENTRIVALAKRLRRITVSLEGERAETARLRAELAAAQTRATAAAAPPPTATPDAAQAMATEIGGIRARWNTAVRKLEEERAQTRALRADLAAAQRVLEAEIGSKDDVAQLLRAAAAAAPGSGNIVPGWKGRAQQIAVLKARLASRSGSADSLAGAGSNAAAAFGDQHRAALVAAQRGQRLDIARLRAELESANARVGATKTKLDAAQTRIRALENDAADRKARLELVLQKTQHDDQFITALQLEIEQLHSQQQHLTAHLQETQELTQRQRAASAQAEAAAQAAKAALAAQTAPPAALSPADRRAEWAALHTDLVQARSLNESLSRQLDAAQRARIAAEEDLRRERRKYGVETRSNTSSPVPAAAHGRRGPAPPAQNPQNPASATEDLEIENQSLRLMLETLQRAKAQEAEDYQGIIARMKSTFRKEVRLAATGAPAASVISAAPAAALAGVSG